MRCMQTGCERRGEAHSPCKKNGCSAISSFMVREKACVGVGKFDCRLKRRNDMSTHSRKHERLHERSEESVRPLQANGGRL